MAPFAYIVLAIIIAIQAATAQRFNDPYTLPAVTIESSNGTCPNDEVTDRAINNIRGDIEEQLRKLRRYVCIQLLNRPIQDECMR